MNNIEILKAPVILITFNVKEIEKKPRSLGQLAQSWLLIPGFRSDNKE
jgi:hypothetical protein